MRRLDEMDVTFSTVNPRLGKSTNWFGAKPAQFVGRRRGGLLEMRPVTEFNMLDGDRSGIVSIETIFSSDIVHECLQNGVPVGEDRSVREVIAHLLFNFRDSLVLRIAFCPFATRMDGIEWRFVISPGCSRIAVLAEPVQNTSLVVPNRTKHSDEMALGGCLVP